MTEKEQLEKLKREIENRKEQLYKCDLQTGMVDFSKVKVLSDGYEAITGKEQFSLVDFVNYNENFAKFIVDEFNEKKNNIVIEEKKQVKRELMFNPLLTNVYTLLNDYYEQLKENTELPNGNYKKWYIDSLITDIPKRKLSEEEIEDIIGKFLEYINPKYKDLYTTMKEEGRIFLLDENLKSATNYGGGFNGTDFDYEKANDIIIIKNYDNDLEKIAVIVHELAHTIEFLELRKCLTKEEFIKFRYTSQYGEIMSGIYELKCFDFLETLDFPKEEIAKIRTKKLIEQKDTLEKIIADIYSDNTTYIDNYNHDLEYTYSVLAAIHFSNLDDKDFKDNMDKYNKAKVAVTGIKILEKINCDNDTLEKTTAKHLKKCM